ncbi:uncharacterized protein LOC131682487 [Topomyia yanbarensis]|uniref:uncharacterized protein LOC131682487 n=1 Tax=Topomyia yanbarensis TaxID=2498891 RepID=UPI00273AE242|nr:uncharacterized protein LOC131682487 [Topomyia yanbarensis]
MAKFLQLHRPTTYSCLQESIPKPELALPKHGSLPLWETLALDRKLPAIACPIHPPTFSRGKLGQHLWTKPDNYGFDLTDPLGHDVSYGYLLPHDKHLKGYYRDERIKDGLKYHEIINSRNEVVCSLAEFNRFRSYLWKYHKHEIRKEFQKLDRAWWKAYHDKLAALHIKKHYDFEGKMERTRCAGNSLRRAKKQRTLKAIFKYEKNLHRFLECREKDKQLRMLNGHLRTLKSNYNKALIYASRKSYRLRLKRRLRVRDHIKTRRMAILKKRNLESKRIMRKERHKMLFISAQQAEAERQAVLENLLQHTQMNVQRRMIRSAAQHERLDRQLTRRKARNLASRYDKRTKSALMKAMLNAWNKIQIRQPDIEKQLSRASVENAVNMAYSLHKTISPTISSTQIIDTARQLISDMTNMPTEQLPMDRQTIRYTTNGIVGIMSQIRKQVVQAGCQLIEQVATKMRNQIESNERRRSTLCSPWNMHWKPSSLHSQPETDRHRVSIGEILIVDEYQTEQEHFKKTRNRPPTPVTSVTSLVNHLIHSNELPNSSTEDLEIPSSVVAAIERSITVENHPLIHLTLRQKRFLETNLMKFRAIIHQNVEKRVLTAIDVLRLEIVGRKVKKPSETEGTIAEEIARKILLLPKVDEQYPQLLLNIINLLYCECCDELEEILNAP